MDITQQVAKVEVTVQSTKVKLDGFHFVVLLGDKQQRHFVFPEGKKLYCACPAGENCPAVRAVEDHLLIGGKTVPLPPPGYYPRIPKVCPICGNGVKLALSLSSPQRGNGWVCVAAGSSHYWAAQAQIPPSARRQTCAGCDEYQFPHEAGTGCCNKLPEMDINNISN